MVYLYLLIAIIAEVIATSSIKASEGFRKLVPSLLVIIGYTISFTLLALVLNTLPVGISYASWSGLGTFFVAILSYFLYKQKLDTVAMCGMTMIIAGVLMINVFSKTAGH
ncbi:DMT family transporter [secondary endosymbiont of Ctenarytaina eucalypti]|uniref:Cation/cationic drug transporter n=1 Tax=secondary endosymbiont of Ctenarytaina eucalypti TaxID=1199245 RepID=J3Z2M7_9ENTR|nr:multidrug efflux SMR transporter [secondary endosymbiont of Ctenarytaina eucalypti]AFP84444.1 cation/cationic drug transporter [secondary endosymbiont of Ctenarytaina eucalypti]